MSQACHWCYFHSSMKARQVTLFHNGRYWQKALMVQFHREGLWPGLGSPEFRFPSLLPKKFNYAHRKCMYNVCVCNFKKQNSANLGGNDRILGAETVLVKVFVGPYFLHSVIVVLPWYLYHSMVWRTCVLMSLRLAVILPIRDSRVQECYFNCCRFPNSTRLCNRGVSKTHISS